MTYYYLEPYQEKILQPCNATIQLGSRWLDEAKSGAGINLFQRIWRGVAGIFVYLAGLGPRGFGILLEKIWVREIPKEEINKQIEIAKDKIFSRFADFESNKPVVLPFIQARFPWERFEFVWLDYRHDHVSGRTFQPDGHAARLLKRIGDSQKMVLVIGIDQEIGKEALKGTPSENQIAYSSFPYVSSAVHDAAKGKLIQFWAGHELISDPESVQKRLREFLSALLPQANNPVTL